MEIAIFRLNNDLDKIIEKLKKEAENEIEKIKKRT
jgi:predicted transcriptional regulator